MSESKPEVSEHMEQDSVERKNVEAFCEMIAKRETMPLALREHVMAHVRETKIRRRRRRYGWRDRSARSSGRRPCSRGTPCSRTWPGRTARTQ